MASQMRNRADTERLESRSRSKPKKKRQIPCLREADEPSTKTGDTISLQQGNLARDSSSTENARRFCDVNSIKIEDPRASVHQPIEYFHQLPPDASFAKHLLEKFVAPTPIQAVSWPLALSGRDVVGIAETGSGKTLAFGLPCIKLLLGKLNVQKAVHKSASINENRKCIYAAIVSPTRELACQIHDQMCLLAESTELKIACVHGGVPKEPQRQSLKVADIVIGTPGRINDFVQEMTLDLGHVLFFVLDEADRMLDKGFEDDIRKITKTLPNRTRQTLMFTATWPLSVRKLAATLMREPAQIYIGENLTADPRANSNIEQIVEVLQPFEKQARLLELLKNYRGSKDSKDRIIVFCLYKKEASRIEHFIRSRGFSVSGIHGDLPQSQRTNALRDFKTGNVPLLVATDVAARGLDIPEVKVVLNFTFPLTVEDYVHRIGRTGRAGKKGCAITLFTEHEKALSGELINVLKAAGQKVPHDLVDFGTTVKRKVHNDYGAFFRDTQDMPKATKIVFE